MARNGHRLSPRQYWAQDKLQEAARQPDIQAQVSSFKHAVNEAYDAALKEIKDTLGKPEGYFFSFDIKRYLFDTVAFKTSEHYKELKKRAADKYKEGIAEAFMKLGIQMRFVSDAATKHIEGEAGSTTEGAEAQYNDLILVGDVLSSYKPAISMYELKADILTEEKEKLLEKFEAALEQLSIDIEQATEQMVDSALDGIYNNEQGANGKRYQDKILKQRLIIPIITTVLMAIEGTAVIMSVTFIEEATRMESKAKELADTITGELRRILELGYTGSAEIGDIGNVALLVQQSNWECVMPELNEAQKILLEQIRNFFGQFTPESYNFIWPFALLGCCIPLAMMFTPYLIVKDETRLIIQGERQQAAENWVNGAHKGGCTMAISDGITQDVPEATGLDNNSITATQRPLHDNAPFKDKLEALRQALSAELIGQRR